MARRDTRTRDAQAKAEAPSGLRRLFPLPFVLIGLGVSWWGVGDLLDGFASEDWPVANGTVTESFVEKHSTSDGTSYSAEVRYAFTVDGVEHRGDRLAFSAWNTGSAAARERIAAYPVGRAVEVAYDPDDPNNAVLEPGVSAGSWGLVAFGATFLGVGCVLEVVFRRRIAAARAVEA